jgi:hypothetical protein
MAAPRKEPPSKPSRAKRSGDGAPFSQAHNYGGGKPLEPLSAAGRSFGRAAADKMPRSPASEGSGARRS